METAVTEYRDAYPCAIEGWCRTSNGTYAQIHWPGRPFQYRIVKDGEAKTEAKAEAVPDMEEALREEQRALGRRAIPRRNADPNQGTLL